MARFMHGAPLQDVRFSQKEIKLALINALMHDTGYIQASDDVMGTGAKCTLVLISRSIHFVRNYYTTCDYFAGDMKKFHDILSCTGVHTMVADVIFQSEPIVFPGKMLGTADLLDQMADRLYLERLLL